jgi:hypothetical protein
MFLTSTNALGINASREYGGEVYPATFEPSCDAYAPIPTIKDEHPEGSTYFHASAADASLEAIFSPMQTKTPFPGLFFRKVVNQPVFGDGKFCNAQLRMFDTSLSTNAYVPRPISASVRVSMPIFTQAPGGEMYWDNAVGMQVDTPFIEQHLVSCEGFRGYVWEDDSPSTSSTMEEKEYVNEVKANSSMAMQSPVLSLETMLANYAVTPANKQATV